MSGGCPAKTRVSTHFQQKPDSLNVSMPSQFFESAVDLEQPSDFFGPYEAYRAECGVIVPPAMLMPNSAGKRCTSCRVRAGLLVPSGAEALDDGPIPNDSLTLANNC
jgi:hypothetical protein